MKHLFVMTLGLLFSVSMIDAMEQTKEPLSTIVNVLASIHTSIHNNSFMIKARSYTMPTLKNLVQWESNYSAVTLGGCGVVLALLVYWLLPSTNNNNQASNTVYVPYVDGGRKGNTDTADKPITINVYTAKN